MITKIGKLNIKFDKIISYFESVDTASTYVDELWFTKQKDKFASQNFSEQQINAWNNYDRNSTKMDRLASNDLIKKYIQTCLPQDLLDKQCIDKNIAWWNIQKQSPGNVTVPHYDMYHGLLDKNKDCNINQISRFWIPLEDSKFGHALFVEDTVLSNFKAGEIYDWDIDDLHAAVNVGFDPRYTLLLYFKKKVTS